ncbi:13766_t:CDS:2 [Funneliformis geosporum]|uniref:17311_t:CDS:1 n=1 Tax=Funneliformis geosporum TaxID=1117311 RepID=A0A9W4WWL4_9GLOM|nr:13766_t:CDS:2 [Funneliformis geosporum]CAI2184483.1 17311_t:CDS:2 [Funneliformis geosporum]
MAAFSSNWRFDIADYKKNTPSRRDGISLSEERIKRKIGMKFLLDVSWSLKLPQNTIATAATYYHRFFMLRSFKKYHKYEIAGACILLACKTEETMRKISQVSMICAKFALRENSYVKNEKEIEAWSKTLKKREPVVAATLCFDLAIKKPKPYQVLLNFLKSLDNVEKDVLQNFATNAWAIINDSYLTPMCLFQKPETIASAAIYLAAQMVDLQLNIDPSNGLCWWEITDCSILELGNCVQEILDSYRIPRGEVTSPDVGNTVSTSSPRITNINLNGDDDMSGSTTPFNVNTRTTHVGTRNGVHTPYDNPSSSRNTVLNGDEEVEDGQITEDGQIVDNNIATMVNGNIADENEMELN